MESQTHKIVRCLEGKYELRTEPIPKPGKDEVLIRVAYSTCNPYDSIIYSFKNEGQVLGCDGCGTIVELGEGVDPSYLNKKVAFFDEAWA